jgi:hypothetical protein
VKRQGKYQLVLPVVVIVTIDLISVYWFVRTSGWPSRLLWCVCAVAVAVYLLRLVRAARFRTTSHTSSPLLLMAPLLPVAEAANWLPELEGQIAEAEPTRRRALVVDAMQALPRLWLSSWSRRVGGQFAWLMTPLARKRIIAINQLLRWPEGGRRSADAHPKRRLRRQLRSLRRYSTVLTWYQQGRRDRDVAMCACRVASLCTRLLESTEIVEVPTRGHWPAVHNELLWELARRTQALTDLLEPK